MTSVHHGNIVGHLGDHNDVVGDQQHAHVASVSQFPQQVEDLCQGRGVDRGVGFVGDQNLWIAGQRHGNHSTLLHAAGEFVRKLTFAALGIRNAAAAKQCSRAFMRGAPGQSTMQDQRFGNLVANTPDGVQRTHRILDDHGNVATGELAHFAFWHGTEVAFAKPDAGSAGELQRQIEQPKDSACGHAFATARFTDQAEYAAVMRVERDVRDDGPVASRR